MDEDFGLGGPEQRDAAEPDAAPGEEDQAMLELPEGFDNRGGAAGPAGAGGEERLPVPEAMEDTVDNQGARLERTLAGRPAVHLVLGALRGAARFR